MSADDRKIIATWLYENFKGQWGKDKDSNTLIT